MTEIVKHLIIIASFISVYLVLYATKDDVKNFFSSFRNMQNNT